MMDATQFQALIHALTTSLQGLAPATPGPTVTLAVPKISVKIPTYRAAPEENVMTWMLQCQNIFEAQDLKDEQVQIHYAATGFEGATLHWYLNRVQAAKDTGQAVVFANWNTFATALHTSFQPRTFNNICANS